ncbi:MAG: FKBP-type peptidyl-prolyl cis-trans isomerase [Bacteroidetes bacterium]|nr:FKBP-type peptidyl-prolyl cis-trans isomerase [Bacteroidota bacterium]
MKVKLIFLGVGLSLLFYSCSLSTDTFNEVTQYTNDTTAISSYLKQNKITASKLSQGIWFSIDSTSTGIRPVFNDSVSVNYTMKLLSTGTVVDQTTSPLTMTLNNYINGIQLAMPQFQQGMKGRMFIPSYYGYGNTANGSVPANTNLLFEFKVVKVYDYQLKADTVAIDKYLKTNSINALTDASGLRYTVDSLGNGALANIQDYVTFTYTAKLMDSGLQIDQAINPVKSKLVDLILGWQIGLVNIPEGSKFTLYVPSRLAYGSTVKSSIPANSNLIFKIQLLKVSQN